MSPVPLQVEGFGALMPRQERYMTYGHGRMPALVQGGQPPAHPLTPLLWGISVCDSPGIRHLCKRA
jgi:hypothetical protein